MDKPLEPWKAAILSAKAQATPAMGQSGEILLAEDWPDGTQYAAYGFTLGCN